MRPADKECRQRHHQKTEQCREQPARAPEPEPAESEAAARDELRPKERGDQEAGKDEENLDTEESARDPGEIRVVEEYGDDGDRTDPVERGDRRDVAAALV